MKHKKHPPHKHAASHLRSKMPKWLLWGERLFIVLAIWSVLTGMMFYVPGPLQTTKNILVEKGEGLSQISQKLSDEHIIYNPLLLKGLAYLMRSTQSVKAGEYRFSPGTSLMDVYRMLVAGKTYMRRITVPEGLTVIQIKDLLSKEEGLMGTITMDPKEGQLLPDTYYYDLGTTRDQLIERMRVAMRTTIDQLWDSRDPNIPLNTKEEAIIMASIVEKETGVPSERTKVASVFENRLKKGMKLQTDPTIVYAITEGRGDMDGKRLLKKHLSVKSPYNTYLYVGLPPGPIANPGIASLQAVLNPAKTNYLYFVADGTGGHAFAATFDEHNVNVFKWRAFRQEKGI